MVNKDDNQIITFDKISLYNKHRRIVYSNYVKIRKSTLLDIKSKLEKTKYPRLQACVYTFCTLLLEYSHGIDFNSYYTDSFVGGYTLQTDNKFLISVSNLAEDINLIIYDTVKLFELFSIPLLNMLDVISNYYIKDIKENNLDHNFNLLFKYFNDFHSKIFQYNKFYYYLPTERLSIKYDAVSILCYNIQPILNIVIDTINNSLSDIYYKENEPVHLLRGDDKYAYRQHELWFEWL